MRIHAKQNLHKYMLIQRITWYLSNKSELTYIIKGVHIQHWEVHVSMM